MGRVMVGVAVLVAGLVSGCATQAPGAMPTPGAMPETHAAAPAPAGFISFCMRFVGQCDAAPGAANTVPLTDQTWRTLSQVNREVNASIWPQDDEAHYGRAEFWTIPTDGYGDCDDYAVTKRKDLLAAGFPAPALRIAVVLMADATRHAVLTVSTDRGDLVLDNLRSEVVPWNATGFIWIQRQDTANPMKWVSLQPIFAQAADNTPTAGLTIAMK
jgi:predicted transglutaminase-like cysteine proteinase